MSKKFKISCNQDIILQENFCHLALLIQVRTAVCPINSNLRYNMNEILPRSAFLPHDSSLQPKILALMGFLHRFFYKLIVIISFPRIILIFKLTFGSFYADIIFTITSTLNSNAFQHFYLEKYSNLFRKISRYQHLNLTLLAG